MSIKQKKNAALYRKKWICNTQTYKYKYIVIIVIPVVQQKALTMCVCGGGGLAGKLFSWEVTFKPLHMAQRLGISISGEGKK